jgi:asparagine N-glycosylation enzyme membrane subunit Stt3
MDEIQRTEERIIEERKEKMIGFFKKNYVWIFYLALMLIVILGVYIRYQPLADHNGKPGLWDYTTNDYTLGPDLDPFLFLRYAKDMIENGSLMQNDTMRNVPLGFDTTTELQMVSYMIVLTHKLCSLFGQDSINYAGAFMPVWFFGLTIIAFFFFVREIFLRKEEKESYIKANIIALISTLFMAIIPAFLSRTVAGIPEKESVGFFFMFLSFFLFIKAWKTEKTIPSCIIGLLAGISTALMGLTWGGVTYLYVTIGVSSLIFFILNKFDTKRIFVYGIWLIASLIVLMTLTNRFSLGNFVLGIDTGVSCFVLVALIFNLVLWDTKLKDYLKLENINVPKTVITLILLVVIGALISFIRSPTFILDKLHALIDTLITPVTGRWSTTVAENKQPYFTEWYNSFGKPIFWLFFIGGVVLFKKMLNKLENNHSWTITGAYILFFFGLVFSRYSAHPALLDGENFISKFIYFGSALLLIGIIIYYYIGYHKQKNLSFEKIEAEYLFLFMLFFLTLFTARSAVRLIMVLVPIAPIFVAYLITELIFKYRNEVKKNLKLVFIILAIVVIFTSGLFAYSYYKEIKAQAYNYVPYYYTLQWQEAMSWVRDNTPANAVFAHWWDYGYWLQSIGDRATVTDGGNAIVWWNYLTGRLVLTGDNQKDALDFLWNHNSTHLLIDSSDIGKYGAFSQIGSDENFDRLSQGPVTLISDSRQIQETKSELIRNYNIPAGNGKVSLIPLEEDLEIETNGTKTILFKENSALLGINIQYSQYNESLKFKQPEAVLYSNGKQISAPMRYLYYNNQIKDFGFGINATAYIIQRVYSSNQGLQLDNLGAMIYLSPRIMRGMLGQVYVLNDPFKKWGAFKLVHNQPDYILSQIESQGIQLGEFTYYQGLRGPIKIWNITYTGEEKVKEEYLSKEPPSDITWKF